MLKRLVDMLRGLMPRGTGGAAPLGVRGERAAEKLLRRDGYRILARGLRNRYGEIDLVAEAPDGRTIAIVEVKAAEVDDPPPEERVGSAKRHKITGLASQLVRRHGLEDRPIRFDVVGVVWPAGAAKPTRVTHHIAAFEAAY